MSAGRACLRHNACSLTGHLNRSIDGVFEIVRVIGRRLVSIAEVHAVVAGAHLAQSEPEMARNRFSFLERHGFVGAPLPTEPLLSRFAVRAGFVILRQRFVCRCQGIGRWATFSSGWVSERRRIEGARSTEPGSLVRRRYSACPVDSCRNVYSIGQPAMSPCGASAA